MNECPTCGSKDRDVRLCGGGLREECPHRHSDCSDSWHEERAEKPIVHSNPCPKCHRTEIHKVCEELPLQTAYPLSHAAILARLFMHIQKEAGEDNPFKRMSMKWFVNTCEPKLAEMLPH